MPSARIRSSARSAALTAALAAFPLAFVGLLFYFPLGTILTAGLADERGRLSLERVGRILTDPYYLRIIGFTFQQAFLSTLLALALGLPGAWLLARYDFPLKGAVSALTIVPFVLPSIIVVLGFVRFFGNNGVLNRALMTVFGGSEPPLRVLYSFQAILLAHAFYNFPIAARVVASLWSRLPPTTEEAARSLGAHGPRLFLRVTLPQLAPAILAAGALIFIFCFLSFAVVLVLGGGPRFSTLEVEVYRLAKVSLDLPGAGALALVGAVLSLGFLWMYLRLASRSSFTEELAVGAGRPRLARLLAGPAGAPAVLYLLLMALVVLAPILTVVVYSLQARTGWSSHGWSLAWYARLLEGGGPYLRAIRNSLIFGGLTVALSLPLGTTLAWLASRRRFIGAGFLEAALMLPLGVSSVILGLGYLKAYQALDWPLAGTRVAVVLAHTVVAYPFVVRAVSPVLRKLPASLPEAARSLGADAWQLFIRLELPMLKGALITGAAFAFGVSVGEINATLMLAPPGLQTMPLAVYRLIGSYNFVGACAMGTLLMLVCALAFLAIEAAGNETRT